MMRTDDVIIGQEVHFYSDSDIYKGKVIKKHDENSFIVKCVIQGEECTLESDNMYESIIDLFNDAQEKLLMGYLAEFGKLVRSYINMVEYDIKTINMALGQDRYKLNKLRTTVDIERKPL